MEALEKELRLKDQEFKSKQEKMVEQAQKQAAQRAAEREKEERAMQQMRVAHEARMRQMEAQQEAAD